MIIDRMREGDPAALAALDKRCFKLPWSEKSFEDELKNELAHYFVAREDGRVIGYAGFWSVSGEGGVTNVAVDEKYRRMRVGSRLIEELIKEASLLGLELLTLEVRRSNAAARGLYTKYGFKVIGVRKGYYSDNREDALIMTKTM